jgi:hypothetical protein
MGRMDVLYPDLAYMAGNIKVKRSGRFEAAGAGYFKVEFQNLMPLFDLCELAKYKYLLRPPLSENYHSWFSANIKHVALRKGSSMLPFKAYHT